MRKLSVRRSAALSPFITSLLCTARPSRVSRCVVSIRIGIPIQRGVWRTRTHVLQEGCKRGPPRLLHTNASTAITVPRMMLDVLAPLNRLSPRRVLTRIVFGVITSVAVNEAFFVPSGHTGTLQAPTRNNAFLSQVCATRLKLVAALAANLPPQPAIFPTHVVKHCKCVRLKRFHADSRPTLHSVRFTPQWP